MSQETISKYLDDNKYRCFTAKEIFNNLNKQVTIQNIHRNLKKLIKHSEYVAYVCIKNRKIHTYYGRLGGNNE